MPKFETTSVLIRNNVSGCIILQILLECQNEFYKHPFRIITNKLVKEDYASAFVTELIID